MDREPRFFVSYSRDDTQYATALHEHLTDHGLPVWMDAGLAWGVTFPREIAARIERSLALIVIMSHGAQGSDWVEREILEGQRHGRPFLPVLRSGERLFLLASSNYFDARDGSLPGSRELRQLRTLRDATASSDERRSRRTAESVLKASPHPEHGTPHQGVPTPVGLEKLSAALDAGRLEHADILTTSVVVEAAGRLDRGWLRRRDGADLPATLLTGIDRAWSQATSRRHGFTAQLELWSHHSHGTRVGSSRAFSDLTLALGWRGSRRDVVPRYPDFAGGQDYPTGFFPTLRNPQIETSQTWHDHWLETVMAVHVRLGRWATAGATW